MVGAYLSCKHVHEVSLECTLFSTPVLHEVCFVCFGYMLHVSMFMFMCMCMRIHTCLYAYVYKPPEVDRIFVLSENHSGSLKDHTLSTPGWLYIKITNWASDLQPPGRA